MLVEQTRLQLSISRFEKPPMERECRSERLKNILLPENIPSLRL